MCTGMEPEEKNQRQPENRSLTWMELLLIGAAIHVIEMGIDWLGVVAGLIPPG